MSAGGLTPSWVASVPPGFGSHAASIERHRFRLVGDSDALRDLAARWRTQSRASEALWADVAGVRGRAGAIWSGPSAGSFDHRAEVLTGELSGTGVSLAFAAEGLLLAADTVDRTRRAGDAAVITYVAQLKKMFSATMAVAVPARAPKMAAFVAEATELSRRTLQAVYAETVTLDAMLATMPRRFQLGPGAPWREDIPLVRDLQRATGIDGSVTIAGVRTTRREGMVLTELQDGRVMVSFGDQYAMGPHLTAGAKVSLGEFSAGVQHAMQRAYGEFGAAPVLGYQQRYLFPDRAAADEVLDRLDGTTPLDRLGSAVRSAAGWVTGPVADFGPWHDQLLGRPPDERSFLLGGTAKGSADAGAWPVGGTMAAAQADTGVTLTVRSDGSSALQLQASGMVRAGATGMGLSGVAGMGEGEVTRVDYDAQGQPVRYTVHETQDHDPAYRGGTTNTSVGLPGGGAQIKADSETIQRTVDSTYLDLTEPANRAAFEQAQVGPLNPVPTPSGDLGDRLRDHGISVTQHFSVDRSSGELGAAVAPFGLKVGPASETSTLLDSQYVDSSRSDRLYETDPSTPRPVPRDPR